MSQATEQPGRDTLASRMVCAGCGWQAPDERPFSFRCERADGDGPDGVADVDHVMTVALDVDSSSGPASGHTGFPHAGDAHPFVRFRGLHHAWRMARRRGLADEAYVDMVRALDERVARVWGHGFGITPYARGDALARELGLPLDVAGRGGLWLKDETGNVAGSHKSRHLMGLAVYIEAAMRVGLAPPAVSGAAPRLAIASCGNAALAAAVIAAGAGWPLDVFVPTWADAAIVERLRSLGAQVIPCPRSAADPPGDPAYHRFVAAVAQGALPFACQGNQNGLTIQGGQTLGWEIAAQHGVTDAPPLDRVFVQVGGGALASSVAQAFRVASALGALPRLPALHAVQSAGGYPLHRAWRRVAEAVYAHLGGGSAGLDDAALARAIVERGSGATADAAGAAGAIEAEMAEARAHRSRYMWPWETEPRSVATGILDDETYDWAAIVEAMLVTGGWPLVAEDADFVAARDAIGRAAGIETDATGAAGVAGLMVLGRAGGLAAGEHVAALVTGAARKAPRG
ncbi:MAG TPA: pyridoxal-phosphate dependent enzyme [Haliangium sp.]|nr:pyridoxal-phosphate dependent enzyme [Haliangium sp.]